MELISGITKEDCSDYIIYFYRGAFGRAKARNSK